MPEHQIEQLGEKSYRCVVCGNTHWKPLTGRCIGVTLYRWGEWPEHLLTKKQMSDAGFQTGKKLPTPAGAVWRDKSPGGIMYLFDRAQGTPKKQVTQEQKTKLDAARKKAVQGWYCVRCECHLSRYIKGGGLCGRCRDYDEAIAWARQQFERGFLILDTETTGLHAGFNEIIEVAVIDHLGKKLFESRIRPQEPEKMFERGSRGVCAHDIHGIDPEQLEDAPAFPQVYMKLRDILKGQRLIIYNREFDLSMLRGDCRRHNLPTLKFKWDACAMEWYSQYVGEERYNGGYYWQSLNGGHTALEDCLAVLERMKRMAKTESPE
jgi:DNA polymerase III subunit epsilon